MTDDLSTESMLHLFLQSTMKSVDMLFKAGLFGQVLIVVYSTIDTLGLLHAPSEQTSASGSSFRAYVNAYVLPESDLECDEADLWAARCAVLHSFTSMSDHTRKGIAKEIQYYSGDKSTERARTFVDITKLVDGGGRHVAVHISDLVVAFFKSLVRQGDPLLMRCADDLLVDARFKNVLQIYPMEFMF